jgi:hypothetical protein
VAPCSSHRTIIAQALNGTPPSKECLIAESGELETFEPYAVDL